MSETARSDPRTVVAVVLWYRGRIGLFKRSSAIAHDVGLWHCLTGYIEAGTEPTEQAFQEIFEETGLIAADLDRFKKGPILELLDASGDVWNVHTFQGETMRRKLTLNWENDSHRWVAPHKVPGFLQVSWLSDVISALESPVACQRDGTTSLE